MDTQRQRQLELCFISAASEGDVAEVTRCLEAGVDMKCRATEKELEDYRLWHWRPLRQIRKVFIGLKPPDLAAKEAKASARQIKALRNRCDGLAAKISIAKASVGRMALSNRWDDPTMKDFTQEMMEPTMKDFTQELMEPGHIRVCKKQRL